MGIVLSGSVQVINVDYYGNRTILSGAEPSELFAGRYRGAMMQLIAIATIGSQNGLHTILNEYNRRSLGILGCMGKKLIHIALTGSKIEIAIVTDMLLVGQFQITPETKEL